MTILLQLFSLRDPRASPAASLPSHYNFVEIIPKPHSLPRGLPSQASSRCLLAWSHGVWRVREIPAGCIVASWGYFHPPETSHGHLLV